MELTMYGTGIYTKLSFYHMKNKFIFFFIKDTPKSKINDKSFSKAWSKSDLPGGAENASSSSLLVSSFERGKLNKSDGEYSMGYT